MKYDYIIIGLGISGYEFSRLTKKYTDANILIIEKSQIGGVALATGAVPMKAQLDKIKYGLNTDFLEIKEKVEEKILKDLENIDIVYGEASFLDSKSIIVNNKKYIGEKIIIATGTSAGGEKHMEIDGEKILSHVHIFEKLEEGDDLIIVGGDVEAVEIASFLSRKHKVTMIEKEEELLKSMDRDLVDFLIDDLKTNNVDIITGCEILDSEIKDKVKLKLSNGKIKLADKLILAYKRIPNIIKDSEKIGLELKNGFIKTIDYQTSIENIYAIGDINGNYGMAHMARNQGLELFLKFNNIERNFEYNINPRGIFSVLELAGVGKQERDLKGLDYKVYVKKAEDNFRAITKDEFGFIKLIIMNEKILGLWIIGKDIIDTINYFGHIIKKEISIKELIGDLIIHPSLTESLRDLIIEANMEVENVSRLN